MSRWPVPTCKCQRANAGPFFGHQQYRQKPAGGWGSGWSSVIFPIVHGDTLRAGFSHTLAKVNLKIIQPPILFLQPRQLRFTLADWDIYWQPSSDSSVTFWEHKYPTLSVILSFQLRKQRSFREQLNSSITDTPSGFTSPSASPPAQQSDCFVFAVVLGVLGVTCP